MKMDFEQLIDEHNREKEGRLVTKICVSKHIMLYKLNDDLTSSTGHLFVS